MEFVVYLLAIWLSTEPGSPPTVIQWFPTHGECMRQSQARYTPESYAVTFCVPVRLRASAAYGPVSDAPDQ